jgi:hypothetical protein
MKRCLSAIHLTAIGIPGAVFGLWCTLVIYYHAPFSPVFCAMLYGAALFAALGLTLTRKFRIPAAAAAALLVATALIRWFTLSASNDRDWQTPWAKMPYAERDGSALTIHDIRDFRYRSENDYDIRYLTETYDLDRLSAVELILSYWDGNQKVAHTMLGFSFSDGRQLVVSSETRLQKGQLQNGLAGLFRQYQTLYVFGTESDLLMLRTNFRGEDVYLYPTVTTPAEARILLLDLVERANRLRAKPAFYNTLTDNCSTSLVPSLRKIRPPGGWDKRILMNGLADEMTFERGWLKHDPGTSFAEYKARHGISAKMKTCADPEQYSAQLHAADAESSATRERGQSRIR